VLLDIRNVTKRFGGLVAVEDVSFSVAAGQLFGLIGPNGAGKTTLFNVIAGATQPSEGRIHFSGEDVTGQAAHTICRKGLARTFQIVKPFDNLSVLENVMIGAFTCTRERHRALDAALCILEETTLMPWRDVPAWSLPIGLRKRIEVARALATKPTMLLLDEVMSGLNPTELREMMQLIARLNTGGLTILLVEHVMAAVMGLCQSVVVLHHGKLIAAGSPVEICVHPRVIETYLGEEYMLG
jgi:branched-chain amino acid transport system ATP-binding protein